MSLRPVPSGHPRSGPRWAHFLVPLALMAAPVAAQRTAFRPASPPSARFTTDTLLPILAGDEVTISFTDTSLGMPTSWLWSFGDGNFSTQQNPAHTYGIGIFSPALLVRNSAGQDVMTMLDAVEVVRSTFGFVGLPPALSTMPVLKPQGIEDFVKDEEAAIALGKALFWDIQAGSDGLTACASCHYQAGADTRIRNTINPGPDGVFDVVGGPNAELTAADFPFVRYADPDTGTTLLSVADDIRGAAGVHGRLFEGIDPNSSTDLGSEAPDGTFNVDGINTFQVTGRDAPSVIGAVFFERSFWDGRANNKFNGRSIWGDADTTDPKVLVMDAGGALVPTSVSLKDAALASQAVGPPLSGAEMSWSGRDFMDLGKKLVNSRPLADQVVDPADSVLGAIANFAGSGLDPNLTYEDMIAAAFHDKWHASTELTGGFTQMEANFSLFWGLAIQLYESTLIPDQAPYDAFVAGDSGALSEEAKRGLAIFTGKGMCIDCHTTPLFAGGVTADILGGEGGVERMPMGAVWNTGGLTLANNPGLLETGINFNPLGQQFRIFDAANRELARGTLPTMSICGTRQIIDIPLDANPNLVSALWDFRANVQIQRRENCDIKLAVTVEWNELGPAPQELSLRIGSQRISFQVTGSLTALYDNGFYNIGVTPTSEDPGVGGNSPFGPLSLTRRLQQGEDISVNSDLGQVAAHERVAVDGGFKTPTLRNIELSGPYMHNGSMATLEQVVEFYARGSNFGSDENRRDWDPDVGGFELIGTDKADLVAFLKALTDERVRYEAAPFDHPQLPLKRGHLGDGLGVVDDGLGNALPNLDLLPATGFFGGDAVQAFADKLPAAALLLDATPERDGTVGKAGRRTLSATRD